MCGNLQHFVRKIRVQNICCQKFVGIKKTNENLLKI